MKLWLDDVRQPPDDTWTWAKCVGDAIELMQTGLVVEAALDHDLLLEPDTRDGIVLCEWMRDNDVWPRDAITVHTVNNFGSTAMCNTIERSQRYPHKLGRTFMRLSWTEMTAHGWHPPPT